MFYKPNFAIETLIKAGIHFGHKKNLWNSKMKKYIYGIKNKTHIIDLKQTELQLYNALKVIFAVAYNKGKIIFINTKLNSKDIIQNTARKCSQYYINHRWLGGILTNWFTISKSINKLKEFKIKESDKTLRYKKKEIFKLQKEKDKLYKLVGGIKDLKTIPSILFVIDVKTHSIAVKEANRLGIPVVGIVDTNSSPDGVDFVIPGNDDSRAAVNMYCKLILETIIRTKITIKIND